MKKTKIFTIASAAALVLAVMGLSVLFTASSTTEDAQQHLITKLSADVKAMQVELDQLKEDTKMSSSIHDPTIGQIAMFGGNFAPRGWAFCDGQLLPISSNEALFSLLGTTYGGDGRTTFALPDLRGRAAVHRGGLSNILIGQKYGVETVAVQPNLTTIPFSGRRGSGSENNIISNVTINNGQPLFTVGPRIGINYVIALEGVYTSRN